LFLSNIDWTYITPDGGLYAGRTGERVLQFSSEFHADPSRLYQAYENSRVEQRTQEQDDHDNLFYSIGERSDLL